MLRTYSGLSTKHLCTRTLAHKIESKVYTNVTDDSVLLCVMLRYWNDGFNGDGYRVLTVLDPELSQWVFIPYKTYAPRFLTCLM